MRWKKIFKQMEPESKQKLYLSLTKQTSRQNNQKRGRMSFPIDKGNNSSSGDNNCKLILQTVGISNFIKHYWIQSTNKPLRLGTSIPYFHR
jgi:hypothetical protein